METAGYSKKVHKAFQSARRHSQEYTSQFFTYVSMVLIKCALMSSSRIRNFYYVKWWLWWLGWSEFFISHEFFGLWRNFHSPHVVKLIKLMRITWRNLESIRNMCIISFASHVRGLSSGPNRTSKNYKILNFILSPCIFQFNNG